MPIPSVAALSRCLLSPKSMTCKHASQVSLLSTPARSLVNMQHHSYRYRGRLQAQWAVQMHLQRHCRSFNDTVLGLQVAVAVASSVHIQHLQSITASITTCDELPS